MLPAERNERWVMRIGVAVLILMALFLTIWIARFVKRNADRVMKQRDIPTEEGRLPLTGLS
jgi:hypothetical protein